MYQSDFLRGQLKSYVIDEGYLAYACMTSDLIFNLVKQELTKRYPIFEMEGIHTGSFRILSSFKSPELSIYDPVEFRLNMTGKEPNEVDPTQLYFALLEIFEDKTFLKDIISKKWIKYEGFFSSGFSFSSTLRAFGGINLELIPTISKQSIDSVYPPYPEKKNFESSIKDFTPFIAYSFKEILGSSTPRTFSWEKDLSYAFLVWFENETRDTYNSFNRSFDNLSYRYRPFRLAVVVLIFLKMHLLIYAAELYGKETLLLITYISGVAFSQRRQRKNGRLSISSPFSSFQHFVVEAKSLIKKSTMSHDASPWRLSHPCDERINLIESWNDSGDKSLKFFRWLEIVSDQFSDFVTKKTSESPEEYLKQVFVPILNNRMS